MKTEEKFIVERTPQKIDRMDCSRCLVIKIEMKTEEKFTVEKWPKNIYRVDSLGLGICQRFGTI